MENKYLNFYDEELVDFFNNSRSNQAENYDFVFDLHTEPQHKFHKYQTSFRDEEPTQKVGVNISNEWNKVRKVNVIETNPLIEQKHMNIIWEKNSKEVNFNKFVRGKTLEYLKVLENSRLLDEEEIEVLRQFKNGTITHQNYENSLKIGTLKEKTQTLFNSSLIIKSIFQSEASFSRKLLILKTIQKIKNKEKEVGKTCQKKKRKKRMNESKIQAL